MSMKITLAAPQKILYSGSADAIRIRTTAGEVQILPGHAQYIAEIGNGAFRVDSPEKTIRGFSSGGVLYNCRNEVSVLLLEPYKIDAQT